VKVTVEVTDTFSGEANYVWVKRFAFDALGTLSRPALVRRVKRLAGWTGARCLVVDYGDTIELRPYGQCLVAFINFGE
jgi:hypothetical protein